jgi:hypothetical protein
LRLADGAGERMPVSVVRAGTAPAAPFDVDAATTPLVSFNRTPILRSLRASGGCVAATTEGGDVASGLAGCDAYGSGITLTFNGVGFGFAGSDEGRISSNACADDDVNVNNNDNDMGAAALVRGYSSIGHQLVCKLRPGAPGSTLAVTVSLTTRDGEMLHSNVLSLSYGEQQARPVLTSVTTDAGGCFSTSDDDGDAPSLYACPVVGGTTLTLTGRHLSADATARAVCADELTFVDGDAQQPQDGRLTSMSVGSAMCSFM